VWGNTSGSINGFRPLSISKILGVEKGEIEIATLDVEK
jgi:hypothetical protein